MHSKKYECDLLDRPRTQRLLAQKVCGSPRRLHLARYDVLGSLAHITMLEKVGLLAADELSPLCAELKSIYAKIEAGDFTIEDGMEDVHSQIEYLLTLKLGDQGKKIHAGRSRNDQVSYIIC